MATMFVGLGPVTWCWWDFNAEIVDRDRIEVLARSYQKVVSVDQKEYLPNGSICFSKLGKITHAENNIESIFYNMLLVLCFHDKYVERGLCDLVMVHALQDQEGTGTESRKLTRSKIVFGGEGCLSICLFIKF